MADKWDPLNARPVVNFPNAGINHNAIYVNFSTNIGSGTPGVTYNDLSTYNTADYVPGTTWPLVDIDNAASGITMSRGKNLFGTGWITGDSNAISQGGLWLDRFMFQRQGRLAQPTVEFRYIDFILTGLESASYELKSAGYRAIAADIYQVIRVTEDVDDPLVVNESHLGQLAGPGEVICQDAREELGSIISDWNSATIQGGMESGSALIFTPRQPTVRVRIESLVDTSNLFLVCAGYELRKL